jgi:hypothetical protein
LHRRRQHDIEIALGVPQQQHHERLKGTLRRQRPFLRDVKAKIDAALTSEGVITKKGEARELERLKRDLDRVLSRLDAVVPTRPKAAPKMRGRHGLLIALAPVPASPDDDYFDDHIDMDGPCYIPGPNDYDDDEVPF